MLWRHLGDLSRLAADLVFFTTAECGFSTWSLHRLVNHAAET